MAVRLAVGETHLVKENKEYFEKEGVDLSVLESSKGKGRGKGAEERSRTVILVKNLPYSTDAAELAKRFGAFGDVSGVHKRGRSDLCGEKPMDRTFFRTCVAVCEEEAPGYR